MMWPNSQATHPTRASIFVALGLILGLGGCGPSFFSGASSMRVEVEVYKGPLSKSEFVQKGELCGVLKEARQSLEIWRTGAKSYFDSAKCGGIDGKIAQCAIANNTSTQVLPPDGDANAPVNPGSGFDHWNVWWFAPEMDCDDCKSLYSRQGSAKKLIAAFDNKLSAKLGLKSRPDIIRDTLPDGTIREIYTTRWDYKQSCTAAGTVLDNDFVMDAVEWATQLKAEAFFWAYSDMSKLPANPNLRKLFTDFAAINSEFANQITARADVLSKQFIGSSTGSSRIGAGKLPTSDYLRDSEVTRFVELYDWFVGARDEYNISDLSREDKIRVARQLFSDHYWSSVNQVHANGQGDVHMVFVKDEIGNWNLKSFSNDPAELLKAYTDVGKAIIGTVATFASGGSSSLLTAGAQSTTNISAAQKALALARKVSFGAPPDTAPKVDAKVEAFRAEATTKLENVKKSGGKPAEGSIRFTANPADNATISLNGAIFKFVPAATASPKPDEIKKGANPAGTLTTAVGVLNGVQDPALQKAREAAYHAIGKDTLVIIHREPGTQGNKFTIAASSSPNANATVSGTTLTGGTGPAGSAMRTETETILNEFAIQIDTLQKVSIPEKK